MAHAPTPQLYVHEGVSHSFKGHTRYRPVVTHPISKTLQPFLSRLEMGERKLLSIQSLEVTSRLVHKLNFWEYDNIIFFLLCCTCQKPTLGHKLAFVGDLVLVCPQERDS